ncbi:MAG: S8 family serine peptidase [Chloroflexi bacterium]|nr:S8 family serine peptidase [Chloroflexota bacterium]
MNRPRYLLLLLMLLIALVLSLERVYALANAPSAPIRLRSTAFDPLTLASEASAQRTRDALYLVQFVGPVRPEWKAAVQAQGARFYDYIPENAFIARLDDATPDAIRAMPFVRWVGPFLPAYRLAPELSAPSTEDMDASAPLTLTVQLLPDANMAALEERVIALGGRVLLSGNAGLAQYARLLLPRDRIAALASTPNVVWIEPYFTPELYNDVGGGQIMHANQVRADLGLYGAGQIVGVADTGLDVGVTTAAMSDDFEGRIVEGQAICAYFEGGRTSWNDFNGHGTHVAGSVLGNGVLSGSNPAAHDYADSFAGVAPEAQLVFQSIDHEPGGGLECVPPDLINYLFKPAYQKGARIHTNSWGGPTGGTPRRPEYGGYNANAQQADAMMWQYKDMLLLYAAGNSGEDADRDGVVDLDAIGSPGTAKNVITVGASESVRPNINFTWGQGWPDSYPSSPIRQDKLADNADGMAAFSSRGPTDDGRIKPDLVAPGTAIISARSHDPQAGTGWGEYNQDYIYEGGTSMATPLTAGAAALVREWLIKLKGATNPSAALIKALLINGAADMAPGQYGAGTAQEVPDVRPNNVTGWGRVDLAASLEPTAGQKLWFVDNTEGLSTGEQVEYAFTVGRAATSAASAPSRPAPLNPNASPAQPFVGPAQTSPQGLVQLLQNPGWESGAWHPWQTYGNPQLTTQSPHSGSWAVHLGGTNNAMDQVWQEVDVPSQSGAITVRFWYRIQTQETYRRSDRFCYGIWNESGQTAYVLRCADLGATGSQGWVQETYSLRYLELIRVLGERVLFGFFIDTDGSLPSTVWVDDAAFEVSTSGGDPTPTPTPTPTPGPTGGPLRLTLAWTDYPGSPTAGKALVNDLDLEVIAPNGTRYYGNQGVYQGGPCLREGKWDACNNVEGVIIPAAAYGTYRVIVHAYNIPQGPQPFALVVTGDNLREGAPTPDFDHAVFLPLTLDEGTIRR